MTRTEAIKTLETQLEIIKEVSVKNGYSANKTDINLAIDLSYRIENLVDKIIRLQGEML